MARLTGKLEDLCSSPESRLIILFTNKTSYIIWCGNKANFALSNITIIFRISPQTTALVYRYKHCFHRNGNQQCSTVTTTSIDYHYSCYLNQLWSILLRKYRTVAEVQICLYLRQNALKINDRVLKLKLLTNNEIIRINIK